jgi:cell division protein FtsQ
VQLDPEALPHARLQRLFEAGALLLVVLGFLAALRSPLLDVDRVLVSGHGRTSEEAVRAAADLPLGTQLIDVDLRAVGERVAALPWVDEATIARRVDGTVEITVTERVPVAEFRTADGTVLLVDAEGRALGPSTEAPDLAGTLVMVDGAVASLAPGGWLPDDAADVLEVAAALGERLPGAVQALEVTAAADRTEILGHLSQGGVVRFGDAGQLDAKLLSLVTVLDQVDTSGLAVLDLRLPGNPVLTREGA